jgi:hypothetical protein
MVEYNHITMPHCLCNACVWRRRERTTPAQRRQRALADLREAVREQKEIECREIKNQTKPR